MMNLVWLIPLFPLVGFLITGLNVRRLPVSISGWIASAMVLLSFILSLLVFLDLAGGAPAGSITISDWIKSENLNLPIEFLIDPLSSIMMLIITGVGLLIHVYSIGYMHGDEGYNRFFSYMNLFIFFMLLLVMGGSYPVMFIGWEGVGFCSYLLIGFWNRNHENNNAARKAFIMNRIGDLGFLLGMFLIFTTFGSLSYNIVFLKAATFVPGTAVVTIITLLLFAGATGKSAQIPLLTWLPDAMAGPTPVSALIHAATMVTAGVYMVARSNILYALSPVSMTVVASIGLATALVAAVIALFQNDIKKVLAYSTVSQLGLMFLGLGVGSFAGAMFHLMTHAFFKALLFLAAGSIIHSLSGEQDIRNMGGLQKKLPWTYLIFLTGALAISGVPPFSGFFSKDEILAAAFSGSPVLWVFGIIVSFMTASYVFRLFWLIFKGSSRGKKVNAGEIHESPKVMLVPLVILAVLSAFGAIPLIFSKSDSNSLAAFLDPVFRNSYIILQDISPLSSKTKFLLMSITFVIILFSICFSYVVFVRKKHLPPVEIIKRKGLIKLAYNKFYIDELYNSLIVKPLDRLSGFFQNNVDIKIFDRLVESTGKLVMFCGSKIRLLQTGNVGFYLFAMVICIIIVLFFNLIK
ncbi:MAG: NADH-quinone oxidoreductase subunit L [Bacteroidota bacterium]